MKVKQLISEAEALPIEDRALVVDSLLRSLNTPEPAIDTKWLAIAQKRLQEIRSGSAEKRAGDDVFAKLWQSQLK